LAVPAKNLRWKEDLQRLTESIGKSIGRTSLEHLPQVMIDGIRQVASGIEAGIVSETERKGAENRVALEAKAQEISTKLNERFDSTKKSRDEELDRRFSRSKGEVDRKLEETGAQIREGKRQVEQSREAATGSHTAALAADLSNKEALSTAKAMDEKAGRLEAAFTEYTSGLNSLKVEDDEGKELTGMAAFKVIVSKLRDSMKKMQRIDTIFSSMAPLFKVWAEGIEVKTAEGNKNMTLVQAINYLVRAYADAVVQMKRSAEDAKSAEGIARDMLLKHTESVNALHNKIQGLSSTPSTPGTTSAATEATELASAKPSSKPPAPAEAKAPAPDMPDLVDALKEAGFIPGSDTTMATSKRTLAPPFPAPPGPEESSIVLKPSPAPVICPAKPPASRDKSKDIPSLAPPSEPPLLAPAPVASVVAAPVAAKEEATASVSIPTLSQAEILSKRFAATDAMIGEIFSRMKPSIDTAYDEVASQLEGEIKKPSFNAEGVSEETLLEVKAVSALEKLDSHLRTLSIILDNEELQEEMKKQSYDFAGATLDIRMENSFKAFTDKAKRLWDGNSFRSEPPSMTAMKTLTDGAKSPKGGES